MVMLCVVCAWHAIIAVCPTSVAAQWDNWALISLAVIYTLFHVFFFFWMYFVVSQFHARFPPPVIFSSRLTVDDV